MVWRLGLYLSNDWEIVLKVQKKTTNTFEQGEETWRDVLNHKLWHDLVLQAVVKTLRCATKTSWDIFQQSSYIGLMKWLVVMPQTASHIKKQSDWPSPESLAHLELTSKSELRMLLPKILKVGLKSLSAVFILRGLINTGPDLTLLPSSNFIFSLMSEQVLFSGRLMNNVKVVCNFLFKYQYLFPKNIFFLHL